MNNSRKKQTRQTPVTSLFSGTHTLALCALTLVCSTALAPILPAEAQTCMTESLLYTYDGEPVAKAPARHKVSKKTATKNVASKNVASKNVASKNVAAKNVTVKNVAIKTAPKNDATNTASVEVATVAPAATVAPVHIAENSLTSMRNYP